MGCAVLKTANAWWVNVGGIPIKYELSLKKSTFRRIGVRVRIFSLQASD